MEALDLRLALALALESAAPGEALALGREAERLARDLAASLPTDLRPAFLERQGQSVDGPLGVR